MLPHLTDGNLRSAWWNVPRYLYPDQVDVEFQRSHWDLEPREPRLTSNVVFLTHGGAISYAESCMGIVEGHRLAAIVGEATAGTNGNINRHTTPGGYRLVWTGMKVTKHDDTPHQGIGNLPTHPVQRTVAGIAAGRDEYLEAALAIVQAETPGRPIERIQARGSKLLRDLQQRRQIPGLSAGLILADGTPLTFHTGHADREAGQLMQREHRLLSGSIGKTYVTAAAHHLVAAGELDLDQKAIEFFADDEWYLRLPNAEHFTVRQLLRHQTGIPRHVFQPDFFPDCAADPDRVWKPRELLAYVFDLDPLFEVGQGWAYADTNYIIVGMILERVSGTPFYDYVKEHLLDPHGLVDTVPTDSRRIEGLAQGYIASPAFREMAERSLVDGVFFLNPQFEWCGGGYASTAIDLARWAHLLYRGDAFEGEYLESMLDSVPVRPGSPVEYGLGVFLRNTPHGPMHGHDGIMTGYLASAGYLPDHDVAVAVMMNTDDGRKPGKSLAMVAQELAGIAIEEAQR